MDDKVKKLYKKLKLIRIERNISQTNLSEYIGFNLSSSFNHVESGQKNISVDKLIKWLDFFDIDLNEIIDKYNEERKNKNYEE